MNEELKLLINERAKGDKLVAKAIEALYAPKAETNANEVEHTSNTGYGAELIPSDVLSQDILELVQQESRLLPMLPGDHGTGLAPNESVPVVGELGEFLGNTEWTTGAGALSQGNSLLPTAKVTIPQASFIKSIDVSKRELNYAPAKLEGVIKERLAKAMAGTIDGLIINGDSESGGTGNVNSDDGAPTSTNYYMQIDHGIRELGINGTGTSADLSTLAASDFITLLNILGDFATNTDEVVFIMNRATYNKALLLADFADAAQRGEKSTVAGAAITNVFGCDVLINKYVPKTEADGKVSTTASNNTKGQIVALWKPAVQYGFGQEMELDVTKIPGKGVQITATFDFGFVIAQKVAGYTDSSVAVGYNITL